MSPEQKTKLYLDPGCPPPHPSNVEDLSLYLEARRVLQQTVGATAIAKATEAGAKVETISLGGRMLSLMAV